jgi:hypothetical protein
VSPHLRYPPCLPWHPEQEVEVVHENLKNAPSQGQPSRRFFLHFSKVCILMCRHERKAPSVVGRVGVGVSFVVKFVLM